jgi:hypothetical protein
MEPKMKAMTKRKPRTSLDYGNTDAAWLKNVINSVIVDGSAIMFGRTRDETALSVLVFYGNDKLREYITSFEDIVPVVESMLDDVGILLLPYGLDKTS